ncbi:hypothetical protein ACIPY6_42950 [Streptomyces sp. NPDC090054]|uniref:hypothetical protein n=1 Tax=Streptomyces sp. NPDC090054 TaxID=3365933 RepID=UPI0037F70D01
MLRKLLKKIAIPPIHEAADEAWKRGDTVFIRKHFPRPGGHDVDLAKTIQSVTDIGWTLASTQFEGQGLQRHANLVFTRPAN